jgi:hypothetical protein
LGLEWGLPPFYRLGSPGVINFWLLDLMSVSDMAMICIYFLRFVVLVTSFLIIILYLLLFCDSNYLMPDKDRSSSGAFL